MISLHVIKDKNKTKQSSCRTEGTGCNDHRVMFCVEQEESPPLSSFMIDKGAKLAVDLKKSTRILLVLIVQACVDIWTSNSFASCQWQK